MSNINRRDPLVSEVNSLLVTLGKLDKAAEDAGRVELRDAWAAGAFGVERAQSTCRKLRSQIGGLTSVARSDQRTGASARITESEVPEGRYALDPIDGINETVFYVVKWWDGRNGRMASVYLQVSDDEQKLAFKAGLTVIGRIKDAGVREATIRYGREIGRCGVCGRTLTNDESRAAGIGPICADKL